MADEATNLTRALKGQSQSQGAWGEMILETVLQNAGLREGQEYIRQKSATNFEGQRLRPDVVVRTPGENPFVVVIDSKVSLTAFERHCNGEGEDERETALAEHVKSVEKHIAELSKKDYAAATGSPVDYVIMFVANEGALAAAQAANPEISRRAIQRNVGLATPNSLMTILRTTAAMWRLDRQSRNAEEIGTRAGLLYDKFVSFTESLGLVEMRIDQARSAVGTARGQLATGPGNLVSQVEKVKALGARTKKSLPAEILAVAEESMENHPLEPMPKGDIQ